MTPEQNRPYPGPISTVSDELFSQVERAEMERTFGLPVYYMLYSLRYHKRSLLFERAGNKEIARRFSTVALVYHKEAIRLNKGTVPTIPDLKEPIIKDN